MSKSAAKKVGKLPKLIVPKAAKPRRNASWVHVEVLQNGTSVASLVRPVKRVGKLAVTSEDHGELALPHYPLPDGKLPFLEVDHGHVNLIVDHKWEGFCTTRGTLHNIPKGEKGKRLFQLHDGDYGAIGHDDLRIMVKVAPAPKAEVVAKGTDSAYRASFVRHFFTSKHEWIGLGIGVIAALFIIGGFTIGLSKRPYLKPTKMTDVEPDYMLTFLDPAHLKHAPEALQQNLDRAAFVRSVMEFYQSYAAVLMAWPGYEARLLHPSTIASYEGLYAAVRETVAAHISRQRDVDAQQLRISGVGVPAIPAVIGETVGGSMLRIIDKIGIMHESFGRDLAAKRSVITTFTKDAAYDFEEYRNLSPKDDRVKEYLEKARPFQLSTDEQLMYAEADRLASAAQAARPSGRSTTMARAIDPQRGQPVGFNAGVKFASFLGDFDFFDIDKKMYKLQGVEYGVRRSGPVASKEPLVGELDPNLVERFIKQNRFQLQLCYELALRRNEGARGTMEWRWRIDSRGLISDVALQTSTIKDLRMQSCIKQKISNWRFPRPRRGSVEVSYPFEFAPTKG